MAILMDAGQVLDVSDRFQAAGVPGGGPFSYPADGLSGERTAGRIMPCLIAAQRLRFHFGDPPTDKGRHDMRRFRDRLGLAIPPRCRGVPGESTQAVLGTFAAADEHQAGWSRAAAAPILGTDDGQAGGGR
jgi:hypothetical protein